MEAINVNVKIQIGVTDELLDLLRPVIKNLQPAPTREEKNVKPDQKPEQVVAKPEAPAEEPAVETPQANEPETVPETSTEQATKVYTEVDVRAAMDAARKRIEGEDYKTNTESEGRKNWHRKLTAWFKNTAAVLGADKPSELPDSDSRAAFISCCERVVVENNELVNEVPF